MPEMAVIKRKEYIQIAATAYSLFFLRWSVGVFMDVKPAGTVSIKRVNTDLIEYRNPDLWQIGSFFNTGTPE